MTSPYPMFRGGYGLLCREPQAAKWHWRLMPRHSFPMLAALASPADWARKDRTLMIGLGVRKTATQ